MFHVKQWHRTDTGQCGFAPSSGVTWYVLRLRRQALPEDSGPVFLPAVLVLACVELSRPVAVREELLRSPCPKSVT
jgi:hypothetical protein